MASYDIMDCVYAKEDFKVFHRIPTHAPMSVFELAVLAESLRVAAGSYSSAAGNSNSFTAQAGDDSPTHIRIPRPSLFQSPTNLFQNPQHLKSEFIINFEYLKGNSL